MIPVDIQKEEISVKFQKIDLGWLYFTFVSGEQVFENRFSEVYDPIKDFKKWLEAISIGVQQTSFFFDNEGVEIQFNYNKASYDREFFTISIPENNNQILLQANVYRRQLVKACYMGLIDFANSDRYNPAAWEFFTVKEEINRLLGIKETDLIDYLLQFSYNELKSLYLDAVPLQTTLKLDELNIYQKLRIVFNQLPKEEQVSTLGNKLEIPVVTHYYEDYDQLMNNEKRLFIRKNINENLFGYEGTKLSEFKSTIIEDFLVQQEDESTTS